MDVRCERCRVQYTFGEDQVGPDGLTVRCSNCGHVFLVKKKALVVTVPVKPGDLRQEPVATADLDRKAPPPQPAAPSRGGAEKSRPWTLRNHRGDLYPFKELSTLQKWIVERKAARDDEVSHLGGPWKRLGDMLELEPFFALVDRAERAAAPAAMRARGGAPASGDARGGSVPPTLIDFPPPRQVFAQQPALEKNERLPAPPEAARPEPRPEALPPSPAESTLSLGSAPVVADEGPVLSGELKPVSGSEPAWTSQPEGVEKPARPPPEPRPKKRAGFGPILVVLALAAGAAAVYLTNPGWLGLAGSAIQRPKPEAPAPAPPPGAAEASPTRAPTESTPPAPEKPTAAEKTAPEKPVVAGKPAGAAEAPVPGTPQPNAAPAPAPPATPSLAARPPGEGVESPSPGPSIAPARPPGEPAAAPPREAEKPTAAVAKEPPASPPGKPAEEPPSAAPAQTRRAAAPQPPVSQKASELKRLLAEGHRLRVRGKPEAALKAYGRAIEAEPKNVDALAGRGLCYLDLSQYGPAEESFHAALDADARHAEALMGLAETYRYEGRRTEAVTYYQRYVAAHPNGEDAAAARNAIDALKE